MSSTRKGAVALDAPRPLAGDILRAAEVIGIFLNAPSAHVLEVHDPRQFLFGDAVLVVDESTGVGHGHNFRTDLI